MLYRRTRARIVDLLPIDDAGRQRNFPLYHDRHFHSFASALPYRTKEISSSKWQPE
ncbi:MAG: hypothetical protein JWM83_792 [Candidatus Angelobacter sp.]|nr:hypothetical protein [Candidatus Angelobacter sp.]